MDTLMRTADRDEEWDVKPSRTIYARTSIAGVGGLASRQSTSPHANSHPSLRSETSRLLYRNSTAVLQLSEVDLRVLSIEKDGKPVLPFRLSREFLVLQIAPEYVAYCNAHPDRMALRRGDTVMTIDGKILSNRTGFDSLADCLKSLSYTLRGPRYFHLKVMRPNERSESPVPLTPSISDSGASTPTGTSGMLLPGLTTLPRPGGAEPYTLIGSE
eukprot:2179603-Prymnesium_polylepis.1